MRNVRNACSELCCNTTQTNSGASIDLHTLIHTFCRRYTTFGVDLVCGYIRSRIVLAVALCANTLITTVGTDLWSAGNDSATEAGYLVKYERLII